MQAKVISVMLLKKPQPKLICLTGTPVSERPDNAYPLIKFIAPELTASKAKFQDNFVVNKKFFFGGRKIVKTIGYKNLDQLAELLSTVSIRRTKVSGMPEKHVVPRTVELGPEQKKVYNQVLSQTVSSLKSESGKIENLTLRLRQVLLDPAILGLDAPSAKFDALEEITDEVLEDPQAKMVVWMSFIGSMKKLSARFKRFKPVVLCESTTNRELAHLDQTFDHSDCRMVFATPQKAGTGLNCLARARTAVYLDKPYSLTLWQQSQDRLKRRVDMESKDPIERIKASPAVLITLSTPGSVDDLVDEALRRKAVLFENVSATTVEDLSVTREDALNFLEALK